MEGAMSFKKTLHYHILPYSLGVMDRQLFSPFLPSCLPTNFDDKSPCNASSGPWWSYGSTSLVTPLWRAWSIQLQKIWHFLEATLISVAAKIWRRFGEDVEGPPSERFSLCGLDWHSRSTYKLVLVQAEMGNMLVLSLSKDFSILFCNSAFVLHADLLEYHSTSSHMKKFSMLESCFRVQFSGNCIGNFVTFHLRPTNIWHVFWKASFSTAFSLLLGMWKTLFSISGLPILSIWEASFWSKWLTSCLASGPLPLKSSVALRFSLCRAHRGQWQWIKAPRSFERGTREHKGRTRSKLFLCTCLQGWNCRTWVSIPFQGFGSSRGSSFSARSSWWQILKVFGDFVPHRFIM